ncbi:MAG: hypothetical protein MUF51_01235, partial [Vicinamibacteria bacterium]|nr:hypothetical protein [Vicinamibacteria bacterium]
MSFHNWGRQGGRRGILPYAWLGVKEAFRFAPRRIRIELANETIEERAWLLTIANGRQYGGGAVITPQALLDDGQLRAVVIRAIPFVALLGAIPLLLAGWLHKMPFYRVWTANTLRFRVDVPCEHHRDGEPEPAGQDFHVRVEPRAMSVRVPQQIFASGHRTFLAGPQ